MHLRSILTLSLLVVACSEPANESSTARTGGKGDETLTTAQCEAAFDTYEACPDVDADVATLPELEANISCLEQLLASPVWECCRRAELAESTFCTDRLEEGRMDACEVARDSYQECALGEPFQLGGCRDMFLIWEDQGWGCCERLETGLCGGPREATSIPDIDALTERITAASGYFQLTDLFDQLQPIDVLPGQLQDSLPLYSNPFATNALEPGMLQQYEVTSRLPVQYAVTGFGDKIREKILEADAYLTLWETSEGQLVWATHYYSAAHVTVVDGGWLHGPTFVVAPLACATPNFQDPGLGDIALALDSTGGELAESCVAAAFSAVDIQSSEIQGLQNRLAARYRHVSGDDSRINTITAAYSESNSMFRGTFVEMEEVPTQEHLDFLADLDIEFIPRKSRLLVNEFGEVVLKYDDEACEADPLSPSAPLCQFER